MITTFTVPFDDSPSWFGGVSATTTLVPGLMPVAIDGHPYMIEPSQYRRDTVEVLRAQSDQSSEPGEASLNPRGLWRRGQESWHHGAGQRFLDGAESDRNRFRASKGVDPWAEGHLSLLNDTAARRASAATNLAVTPVGSYLYVADGTELHHTTDPTVASPTWTSAVINAGQGAQTIGSITTDGTHVWAALGSSGLHRTDAGAVTSTADAPAQACTLVGYALGRLLIANANVLYEVLDPLGSPTAAILMTHPNASFAWTFISPGRSVIYAGGNASNNAEVYRVTLEASGANLGAPTAATYLPDGETIHDCRFYAGGVLLATGKGLRAGMADSAGSIDYGPLIATTSAVRCLEPQDRYVWYGTTNYDGASTGLGRADLGFFTGTLTPAWATDLMATAQGAVLSAATFNDRRYFAVSGAGLYGETATKVAAGTLESGDIRFGTTEKKTARSIDLRHHVLDGSVSVAVRYDNGDWEAVGTSSSAGSIGPDTPFSARDEIAESIELRLTLTRHASDSTLAPEVVRWTFKALPTPRREETFTLPILMFSSVETMAGDGQPYHQDVAEEILFLKDVERSGRIVTLQLGEESFSVFIDQSSHRGQHWQTTAGGYRPLIEGLYLVNAQTLSG